MPYIFCKKFERTAYSLWWQMQSHDYRILYKDRLIDPINRTKLSEVTELSLEYDHATAEEIFNHL